MLTTGGRCNTYRHNAKPRIWLATRPARVATCAGSFDSAAIVGITWVTSTARTRRAAAASVTAVRTSAMNVSSAFQRSMKCATSVAPAPPPQAAPRSRAAEGPFRGCHSELRPVGGDLLAAEVDSIRRHDQAVHEVVPLTGRADRDAIDAERHVVKAIMHEPAIVVRLDLCVGRGGDFVGGAAIAKRQRELGGASASGWGRGRDRDQDWQVVLRTYLPGPAQAAAVVRRARAPAPSRAAAPASSRVRGLPRPPPRGPRACSRSSPRPPPRGPRACPRSSPRPLPRIRARVRGLAAVPPTSRARRGAVARRSTRGARGVDQRARRGAGDASEVVLVLQQHA